MVDRSREAFSSLAGWRVLGAYLAASGGALVALIALAGHVPVWVACLRGGATWFALRLVGRLGHGALARSLAADAERAQESTESPS
jgi:hypothetical protein